MTTSTKSTTKAQTPPSQPQLLLISNDQEAQGRWVLDEQTRETGRKGLAKARAALRAIEPTHIEVAA